MPPTRRHDARAGARAPRTTTRCVNSPAPRRRPTATPTVSPPSSARRRRARRPRPGPPAGTEPGSMPARAKRSARGGNRPRAPDGRPSGRKSPRPPDPARRGPTHTRISRARRDARRRRGPRRTTRSIADATVGTKRSETFSPASRGSVQISFPGSCTSPGLRRSARRAGRGSPPRRYRSGAAPPSPGAAGDLARAFEARLPALERHDVAHGEAQLEHLLASAGRDRPGEGVEPSSSSARAASRDEDVQPGPHGRVEEGGGAERTLAPRCDARTTCLRMFTAHSLRVTSGMTTCSRSPPGRHASGRRGPTGRTDARCRIPAPRGRAPAVP